MQSKRSLDEMQELVVSSYSAVKTEINAEVIETKPFEEIFKPEFFSNMIFVKPINSKNSLIITWVFPSMQKHYKCQPLEYLSKIFKNDGAGGIKTYLQEKQLITGLTFGSEPNNFSEKSQLCMLELEMNLTDAGAANIGEVLEAIFSYLIMLKETPIEEHRRLYNEFQAQKELEFKFHKETTALQNGFAIAQNMLMYEDVDIIRGKKLFQHFDENLIIDSIEKLNERKFNLLIVNSKHETFGKKEKYFGMEYDEIEFPEEYQKLWDERKANSEFYLEKSNPFKTTNFEVFVAEEESPVSFFSKLKCSFTKFKVFRNIRLKFLKMRSWKFGISWITSFCSRVQLF